MAYLTKADLKSHIYIENIDFITREDDAIVEQAISAGIAEAQSYLGRYNIAHLFWDGDSPAPTGATTRIVDQNLYSKVKDVAAWHLVKLSNPNIHLELMRQAYEDAIDWFKQVQKGQAVPYGWPLKQDDPATEYNEGGSIQWTSNPKRNNYF